MDRYGCQMGLGRWRGYWARGQGSKSGGLSLHPRTFAQGVPSTQSSLFSPVFPKLMLCPCFRSQLWEALCDHPGRSGPPSTRLQPSLTCIGLTHYVCLHRWRNSLQPPPVNCGFWEVWTPIHSRSSANTYLTVWELSAQWKEQIINMERKKTHGRKCPEEN